MRRITKNSTLYDLAPVLVKEWHPSANGLLIPTKVTVSFPKKVWWICSQSHKWRATIKSRLKGNGCPICEKHKPAESPQQKEKSADSKNLPDNINAPLGSSTALFETDAFNDNLGHDFRKNRRYQTKATAVLESPTTGHWVYADVKNFSASGMGFEADACIDPGTKVVILLQRPLFMSDQKQYDSIIRWCRILDNDNQSFSSHGMGAEFV